MTTPIEQLTKHYTESLKYDSEQVTKHIQRSQFTNYLIHHSIRTVIYDEILDMLYYYFNFNTTTKEAVLSVIEKMNHDITELDKEKDKYTIQAHEELTNNLRSMIESGEFE